jgi:hypothetical protein
LRRIKLGGVCLVAIVALGAFAAPALALYKFENSGEGTLSDTIAFKQVWNVESGGYVECTLEESVGPPPNYIQDTVHLKNCHFVFGVHSIAVEVPVWTAEYRANGTYIQMSAIKFEVPEEKCTIEFPSFSKPHKGISYQNVGSKLEAKFNVTGLAYKSSGGACGPSGVGTHTGASMFTSSTGSIQLGKIAPAWYQCTKLAKVGGFYHGEYTDKACSVDDPESKGKYELQAGIGKGKAFKGKGSTAILHNVIPGKGDIKVECGSFKDSGQVAVPNKQFNVTTTFSHCKSLGAPCSSGAKKETITTKKLAGELGWLNQEAGSVGASLANEEAPGTGFLAEFECTGLAKVRVMGAVIGQQEGDVGVIAKETKAKYAVGPYLGELAPGYTPLVNPPAFEEGPVGVLLTELNGPETGNTWQPEGGLPSGQEGTGTNKGEALLIQ